MTEEQIKQNAEAYAIENYGEYDEHDYTDHSGSNMCHVVSEKAFIAGAHSRDEEIKELKERLKFADESIADADKWIAKYKLELYKLRNPWIRVNDKLPEEDPDDKGYSVEVLGLFPDGNTSKCFCSIEEGIWLIEGLTCDKPTHWTPIPQLKKGGEK